MFGIVLRVVQVIFRSRYPGFNRVDARQVSVQVQARDCGINEADPFTAFMEGGNEHRWFNHVNGKDCISRSWFPARFVLCLNFPARIC